MKWTVAVILLAILVVVGLSGTYTVPQGRQAIVTQFGNPVGDPITEAGLHFKTPFVQEVRYFEARVLDWDGETNQVPTLDKRFIAIDTTARWQIADPLLFFQEVKDETRAQTFLDDILDAVTRNVISNHNLIEAVRSSNRKMLLSVEFTESEMKDVPAEEEDGVKPEGVAGAEKDKPEVPEKTDKKETASENTDGMRAGSERIRVGRKMLAEKIFISARAQVKQYGIALVDFRIKKINYVESVRLKVYERMISEREKIAERYRSEGLGKAAFIDGQRRRELLEIGSGAYREAQVIRGDAEAEATRIYAEAYSQDPEFFNFMETLSAYEETLDQDTMLILSTDSPFYRYLKETK